MLPSSEASGASSDDEAAPLGVDISQPTPSSSLPESVEEAGGAYEVDSSSPTRAPLSGGSPRAAAAIEVRETFPCGGGERTADSSSAAAAIDDRDRGRDATSCERLRRSCDGGGMLSLSRSSSPRVSAAAGPSSSTSTGEHDGRGVSHPPDVASSVARDGRDSSEYLPVLDLLE
jgi:hypothetical protein